MEIRQVLYIIQFSQPVFVFSLFNLAFSPLIFSPSFLLIFSWYEILGICCCCMQCNESFSCVALFWSTERKKKREKKGKIFLQMRFWWFIEAEKGKMGGGLCACMSKNGKRKNFSHNMNFNFWKCIFKWIFCKLSGIREILPPSSSFFILFNSDISNSSS